MGKKAKNKHRWHEDDALDSIGVSPRSGAADTTLGPMVEVRGYSDMSRTSLVEVVQPDGSKRIVLMPVSGDNHGAARRTVTSVRTPLSELEKRDVEAASATVTEVVGAATRILVDEHAEAVPGANDSGLVRHQVGEALREVAASLAKLADSLDPR